ncbi:YrhA family protein [Sphingosinicella sp. BN140058]|uniref:YrhA family protein n=1 Tax=Sphingosinicella sp. BN140058 TaxID=1892855 RepID=UPI0010103A12|nr:YrhA family protein [Sphingosinicella sp. BN140058]QAY76208.1 hypothetical protein ETR14_06435 [Sphingosinicella sp. BN140058]
MDDMIAQIRAEKVAHGEAWQAPASPDQIRRLREMLREAFGAALSDDYAAFLSRTSGLDHDGLVLYGAVQDAHAPGPGRFWQGLIAANRLWREGPGHDAYVVLGDTDLDLLTVDLDGANPTLRDKISGEVTGRFASVGEMIARCLKIRIQGGGAVSS